MNIVLTYTGSVNDTLKIVNRKKFDKEIQLFRGKEVEITIRKKRKKRSLSQNNFYWGAVVPIVREALYDAGIIMNNEETHELLKLKCNPVEVINKKTGEVISTMGSTTKLTTSEFMDYVSKIKHWAREYLNIEIPEPGELLTIEFKNINDEPANN